MSSARAFATRPGRYQQRWELGPVQADINRRALVRFTALLPPAPAALLAPALCPVSARPVLHPAASLPHEMGGQLGTVQALGEAWSMGGGVGAKCCPPQAFKRQGAAPQSINLLSFLQGLVSFYFEGLWVTFSTTFC